MSQITMLNLYSECRDGELLILDTLLSGSKDAVAAVFLDDSPLKDSVAKSLADLFCAAPELLEACEQLLKMHDTPVAGPSGRILCGDQIDDILGEYEEFIGTTLRMAVARAKGAT